MPKLWNLPMTTKEPISDAKAREFLLPSSSWGSHRYRLGRSPELELGNKNSLAFASDIGSLVVIGRFRDLGITDLGWGNGFLGIIPKAQAMKEKKNLLVTDNSPDRSSRGADGRSRTSPQMLCPSREISQWPPGSRYPMQKQESFYYQARAGAPTVTDAAAKEKSPEFWVTLLI